MCSLGLLVCVGLPGNCGILERWESFYGFQVFLQNNKEKPGKGRIFTPGFPGFLVLLWKAGCHFMLS